MAWSFGDGFDLYTAAADAINGYWDAITGSSVNYTLVAGRFAGSRALQCATLGMNLIKNSGQNDAVHHIVCAFYQTAALSGTSSVTYFSLGDGATAQCSVVFRSDGAILLTSGGPAGTTLDTYTGAVTASATWYAFEIEVVINNTTGSWVVRKNGNTSNDHALGSLDTQNSVNAYANRLTFGVNASVNQQVDDLFWRSDASSVAWIGDIRCYTRMPASDASVQFSRSPTTAIQTPYTIISNAGITAGQPRYSSFVAAWDGTIGTATVTLGAGYTGNMKCSIFASSGSAPTTVLGSATAITNPVTGINTFTFGTPVTVAKGTQYWFGFVSDTSSGTFSFGGTVTSGGTSTTSYASFPAASPAMTTSNAALCSITFTISANCDVVSEAQQDGTATYVYDSTVNDADFYAFGTITPTPTPGAIIAMTTRGYMQKSDAGSRTASMRIKSGSTTVASPTLTLTNSGWQWAWRMDLTDPNTGSAWTAANADNCQIGPVVIS
jgi:hypothetical protein